MQQNEKVLFIKKRVKSKKKIPSENSFEFWVFFLGQRLVYKESWISVIFFYFKYQRKKSIEKKSLQETMENWSWKLLDFFKLKT